MLNGHQSRHALCYKYMSMILTITGVLLLATGVVLAFVPKGWSAPVAWIGLWLLCLGDAVQASWSTLLFWGMAALIAWGITILLPKAVANSKMGVGYIVGAALAGTLVGMLMNNAGMIVGSVAGAFCGALAFSRTPGGRTMKFPSCPFFNYLCAKGLVAVVTTCIAGEAFVLMHYVY